MLVALLFLSFSFASCTTLEKLKEDNNDLYAAIMGCPDDSMEQEFGLPANALELLGPSIYLDKMFDGIKYDFEKAGVDFEAIERGFKAVGIQLEKEKDQEGQTKELVISIDGDMSFDTGSSALTSKANELVDRISKAMAAYPQTKARVEGHTDSVGSFRINKRLSYARAAAVRDRLVKTYNVDPARFISVTGYADTRKIEPTMGPSKRNRRVEIRLVADDGKGGETNELKKQQ